MPFFKHFSRNSPRIYLDFASSTPLDESMRGAFPKIPGYILAANPSALHFEGVALRRFLEEARSRCAAVLEVHADEITFTSGATESDNLALAGVVNQFLEFGIAPQEIAIFSSELEHAAVSETIEAFTARGVQHMPIVALEGVVDPKAIIIPEGIRAAIISVMYVNNEIGTVQPIAEIAKRVRKLRKDNPGITFIFHTDATQAPLYFPLRIPSLGVDMMTLGATKLYCERGVGLLYKKRNVALVPLLKGGGQERGLRPGTQPVSLIHEFSHALLFAKESLAKETERIKKLQEYFEAEIEKTFSNLYVTAKDVPRTPHISHIGIPNFDSELLVIELDARGVAISSKSACKNDLPAGKAGEGNESPVVEKLYGKGYGAIRFSFGRSTTVKELKSAVMALSAVFLKYRL